MSPQPRSPIRRICVGLALAMALGSPARADKTVVIRSVVDHAYAQNRESDPAKVETYVFARGRYFNSVGMDRYLERMDFRTIATTLAKDLRKSFYEPTASLLNADLVLVVHWGVTQPNETAAGQMLYDQDLVQVAAGAIGSAREQSENALAGGLEAISQAELASAQAQFGYRSEASTARIMNARDEGREQSNLEILGLQSILYQEDKSMFVTAMAEMVRDMVNEERYFVIVMAYDAKALREGRKRRVWTTRASIRGPGVNFAIALDRMSGAAASSHGRRLEGLAFEVGKDRRVKEGKVEIGEITVLGEATLPADSTKK